MQFSYEDLKTVEDWLQEVDPTGKRNNKELNTLLRDKVIYNANKERFYRIGPTSTNWHNDQITYLYFIGHLSDYDKIKAYKDIKKVNTTTGFDYSGHKTDFLYILNEYKMTTKEILEKRIAGIKETIANSKKELAFEEGKIQFLEENQVEEFDERQYKIYNTLKALDSGATLFQKSKVLVEIISPN